MSESEQRAVELHISPSSVFGIADIIRAFAEIRVALNLPRFISERWPVFATGALTACSLDQIFTSWYSTSSTLGVAYSERDARSVSLSEAIRRREELPEKVRIRIAELAASYLSAKTPILELLPAYQLGEGKHLLLDGNHRMVAIGASGRRFELHLLSIRGPLDANALPDLIHWQRRLPLGGEAQDCD